MTEQNQKSSERSTDYMLEEFRFLKISFEGSMTERDERFKSFINIIFGMVALLAIIAQISEIGSSLYYFVIALCSVLYMYGLFVFSRVIAYTLSIDRYRNAINKVRKYFVDYDKNLKGYLLIPLERREPVSKIRGMGSGLIGTAAFTNSILILTFGITLFFAVLKWQLIYSIGMGIGFAIISWGLHTVYYNARRNNEKKVGVGRHD